MSRKVWNEITYPFPNCNVYTAEVRELRYNYIPINMNVRQTSKPKLRYHNMFKSGFEIEEYVICSLNFVLGFYLSIWKLVDTETSHWGSVFVRYVVIMSWRMRSTFCVHANFIRRREMYYLCRQPWYVMIFAEWAFWINLCIWWAIYIKKLCILLQELPIKEEPNYTPGYWPGCIINCVPGGQCDRL